ncbi:MAG TPA: hypothetical protein P5079_00845 [Elusimicrobiota bacterium]|nr:hypothetical protein [Elusimicrobiota bacterium]
MKFLRLMMALALTFGVVGCGNNKSKNKVLGGVLYDGTSSSSSSGVSTPNTPAGQAADAAQVAAQVAQVAGTTGSAMGAPAARRIGPGGGQPGGGGGQPGGGMPSWGAMGSDGYYTLVFPNDPQFGSAPTVKIRFEKTDGTAVAFFTILESLMSGGMPDPTTLATIQAITRVRQRVSGTDPGGNTFTATMTAPFGVPGGAGGSMVPSDMSMTGTIDVSGPDGTFHFDITETVSPANNTMSGTLTGTGTLPDGTTVNINLTMTNGVVTGTVTVGGETVQVDIDQNGAGNYRDSTGTHQLGD